MTFLARAGLAIAVATLAAACSFMPTRQFGYSFPAENGHGALPVVLNDTSGSVTGLDEAPAGLVHPIDAGMSTVPQNANAVVIFWLGGACDERVTITTEGSPSVTFVVTTTTKPGACEAVAIPRAVLVQLSKPADMSQLAVRFTP